MDDPPGGGDAGGAAAPSSLRYGQVLQGVSALVAPATLLTGIAFYFGWARVRAFDGYFGLNPAAVGYSTRDYVLDSLDPLFLPVMVVLFGLMSLALGHAYVGRVHRHSEKPETLRRLSEICLVVGLLLLLVGGLGAFGVFPFHTPYLISTLFPAGGVLVVAYAVDLRARLRGDPPITVAGRVFVALFVAVCLFWAAGLYAGTVGRSEAAALARHLDELPGVTITSNTDLALPTGGPTGGTTSSYAYYKLRLLTIAGGTMFLLPNDWKPSFGQLYTIPEASVIRLAFAPGTAPSSASALGFDGLHLPATDTTGGAVVRTRRLGPLLVRLKHTQGTGSSVVRLVNRTARAIAGVSVAAVLSKVAQPRVVGSAASACRVVRSRFRCRVRAFLPKQELSLRVSYRGPRRTHGSLTVRLGARRRVFKLQLSR